MIGRGDSAISILGEELQAIMTSGAQANASNLDVPRAAQQTVVLSDNSLTNNFGSLAGGVATRKLGVNDPAQLPKQTFQQAQKPEFN